MSNWRQRFVVALFLHLYITFIVVYLQVRLAFFRAIFESSHFSYNVGTLPPKYETFAGCSNKYPELILAFLSKIFEPAGVLSTLSELTEEISIAWQKLWPSVSVSFSIRGAACESSFAFGADTLRTFWTCNTSYGQKAHSIYIADVIIMIYVRTCSIFGLFSSLAKIGRPISFKSA